MKPVWLAIVLLIGFAFVSWDDTRTSAVDTPLTLAEQMVKLEVTQPRLRRFENGELVQTLDAPRARDFDQALPSEVQAPQLNWPLQRLTATGDLAELEGPATRLLGNAQALQAQPAQQMNADVMVHRDDVIVATGNVRIQTPSVTGQSDQATWDLNQQRLTLNDKVTTRLWPVD